MKNIVKLSLLTAFIALATTACKEDFLVEEPVNIIDLKICTSINQVSRQVFTAFTP